MGPMLGVPLASSPSIAQGGREQDRDGGERTRTAAGGASVCASQRDEPPCASYLDERGAMRVCVCVCVCVCA